MNKLIIAAAGSGKTTFLVRNALKNVEQGSTALITTFTEACEQEIKEKIRYECGGYIPKNLFVQTWFSFLIKHGVKPFQGRLFEYNVKGMLLVNGKSGFRYRNNKGVPVYWGENDFDKFYFTDSRKIYSDKLAQLTIRCNEASDGKVFDRISRCFKHIYVDEVQDLAGYDLEVLDCFFNSGAEITIVGDPRQATYSTSNTRKHKKYVKSEIVNFFADSKLDIDTDTTLLTVNHRCFNRICDFSNALYPDLPPATSSNEKITGHDGVFALPVDRVDEYLNKYNPIQLRDSIRTSVNDNFEVLNFGKSKGLTFNRVLIYPSNPMLKWLKNKDEQLTQAARSKLYVALTRARNSVAIVLKPSDIKKIDDLEVYL